MRIHSLLVLAVALAFALPLSAGHRHGRDCGHIFDSHRGGWISVQFAAPLGVGFANWGVDRDRRFHRHNDRRYYRDSRSYKQQKKFLKKMRKQRLRDHRRFHQQRRHVHGPHCWR